MSRDVDDNFKLRLLLDSLRITCRYFTGDEQMCNLSDNYCTDDTKEMAWHVACNCYGNIDQCDLPDKFQDLL